MCGVGYVRKQMFDNNRGFVKRKETCCSEDLRGGSSVGFLVNPNFTECELKVASVGDLLFALGAKSVFSLLFGFSEGGEIIFGCLL